VLKHLQAGLKVGADYSNQAEPEEGNRFQKESEERAGIRNKQEALETGHRKHSGGCTAVGAQSRLLRRLSFVRGGRETGLQHPFKLIQGNILESLHIKYSFPNTACPVTAGKSGGIRVAHTPLRCQEGY